MKKTAVFALVAVLGSAKADVTFVQNLDTGIPMDDAANITVHSTDGKYRVDIGNDISSIVDTRASTVITVMHDDRTYFKMADASDQNNAYTPKPLPLNLKKTDQTETISGFTAAAWTAESEGNNFTIWIAEGVPDQDKLLMEIAKLPPEVDPFQGLLRGTVFAAGFPIRMDLVDAEGQRSIMTITQISSLPVTSTYFSPPVGYTSLDPETGKPAR